MPGSAEPAALLRAEGERLAAASKLGPILDVACGSGRNALPLARAGLPVLGLDRSRERLADLRTAAAREQLPIHGVRADLEAEDTMPIATASAGAVVVFRYLHRPLAPELARVLRAGGLLVYETFTIRHREVAEHPRNPAFLLQHDELPTLFPELETLSYEEASVVAPSPAAVARLVARKPGGGDGV
jgi:SAM-dependent methyltransferase